jgi:integrase
VWTAAQTAQFLRCMRGHRLYALFHLVALRGLRRGEAAGLTWAAVHLDAGTLTVSGQLQQLGGQLAVSPPKSDAGRRVVALDRTTIAALREHQLRQRSERSAAGTRWTEAGYVFTTPAGKPFGPDRMTRLFAKLVADPGLPPVTCMACGPVPPPSPKGAELHRMQHSALARAVDDGSPPVSSFVRRCRLRERSRRCG